MYLTLLTYKEKLPSVGSFFQLKGRLEGVKSMLCLLRSNESQHFNVYGRWRKPVCFILPFTSLVNLWVC
jgi:hypothetical protein